MKTYLICVMVILLISGGCKKENEEGAFILNKEVNLKAGSVYRSPAENMTVKVTRITDSRCPEGVYCIWQGEATVYLDVVETETWQLVLSTVHNKADTLNNYVFTLINVLPYPKHQVEVPESKKTVVLQIDKL